MRFVSSIASSIAVWLLIVGCSEGPAAPSAASPKLSVLGSDNPVGAIVRNTGEASSDAGFCRFRGVGTAHFTGVVNPNGNRVITCQWEDYPPIEGTSRTFRRPGFDCFFQWEGVRVFTTRSLFVRTPSGRATMTCTFEEQVPTNEA